MSSEILTELLAIKRQLDQVIQKVQGTTSTSVETKTVAVSEPSSKKPRKATTKKEPVINKRGDVTLHTYQDNLLLTGNTYDRRDLIKSWGGKWNTEHSGWIVSKIYLEEVKQGLLKYCTTVDVQTHSESLGVQSSVQMEKKPASNLNNFAFLSDDEDD